MVIGCAKAGTTSLYHYLKGHPEIFMPGRKEPSFFAHAEETLHFQGPGDGEWSFVTETSAYDHLFADAPDGSRRGDVSPRYLYFEKASERMKERVPDVKIVAILRHPVDRAYSHFLMNRSRGCEPEPDFSSALELWESRRQKGWGWDWDYVGAGLYSHQLQRYLDRFSADQIKVFLYDDLKVRQSQLFEELFAHIGVSTGYVPDTSSRHRKATVPSSYAVQAAVRNRLAVEGDSGLRRIIKRVAPASVRRTAARWRESAASFRARVAAINSRPPEELDPHLRRSLFGRYFAEDVQRVADLIGRDLTHWRA